MGAVLAITRANAAASESTSLLAIDDTLALLLEHRDGTPKERLQTCLSFHSQFSAMIPFASRRPVALEDALQYTEANRDDVLARLDEAETHVDLHLQIRLTHAAPPSQGRKQSGRTWLQSRREHLRREAELRINVSRWIEAQTNDLDLRLIPLEANGSAVAFALRTGAAQFERFRYALANALDRRPAPKGVAGPMTLTGPWPLFLEGLAGEPHVA